MDSSEPQNRRFRLDIAYDGRPFSGWQSQVGGNTIQDIIQKELSGICGAASSIQGSGRTDAGVSAEQQVAHFDVPEAWRMNGGEWQRALNSRLPRTIRVIRCAKASLDFHARFSAGAKQYRYDVAIGEVLPPLLVGVAWHRRGFSDISKLAEVLELYKGQHNFRPFSAKRHDGKDEDRDAVRTLTVSTVEPLAPDVFRIRFRGNGFLYKMVRFLVGSAIYCVEGKISQDEMLGLLQGCELEKKAPFCAPPDGLSLEKVYYPPEFEIA